MAERQAEEIVLLDIAALAGFTDYFVIATATSSRQFQALAQAVENAAGHPPGREGGPDAGWMLFDYGDLVVHLFGREERTFYDLEALWAKGRQLLRIE